MVDLRNDTQRRHLAKADVYRLLSVCYYEPEAAFVEEDVFGQLERALSLLDAEQAAAARALGGYFLETSHESLRIDYTRLFLGPFNILSKPYASVYLEGSNIVMGDTTMAALALYREGGFKIDEAFTEVPDHVIVELEFLYLLNTRLGDAPLDIGDRDRLSALKRRFLHEHLGRWIVPFTEAMRTGTRTEFYWQLSALTRDFVLVDLQKAPASQRP